MRGKLLCAAVLLTILAASPGAANDRLSGIFAVVRPSSESDRQLQEVIAQAVVVRLTLRKAPVVAADAEAARAASVKDCIALAAGRNAEYVLLCDYATKGKQLLVRMDLYDVSSGAQVRTATAEGRIDLSLDDVIERGLGTALSGIELREASADAALPVVDSPGATPLAEPVPEPGGQPAAVIAGRQRLAVSAGAAPMIATGPAAVYAGLGLLATVSFGVRFGMGGGTLGAGILTGACMFSASGAASDALVLLVPLGLDARYSLSGSGPGVTLHASLGPALMVTSTTYADPFLKVIPYGIAGLTLDIPFTAFVGLAIEASYAVFIESLSLAIMAFAPEVSLYARF
jgi:hypothetical protein